MTETNFGALCRAACKTLGIGGEVSLMEKGYLAIDGIPVGLFLEPGSAPHRMFCYADLGPVDPQLQASTYETLLMQNQLNMSKAAGSYGIEPLTGHAVFTLALGHLEQISAGRVADAMRNCASEAKRLRKEWNAASLQRGNRGHDARAGKADWTESAEEAFS